MIRELQLLYSFPIIAVTNYYKFIGLKQYTALSYSSAGEKSKMVLDALKSRYQWGSIPSGGSKGEFISLLFPAFSDCMYSLAYSPFLHLQSQH